MYLLYIKVSPKLSFLLKESCYFAAELLRTFENYVLCQFAIKGYSALPYLTHFKNIYFEMIAGSHKIAKIVQRSPVFAPHFGFLL